MAKNPTNDKPIVAGFITGGIALITVVLWVIFDAFHPLIHFGVYLIALFYLSLSTIWVLSKGESAKDWILKHPAYFFIIGFILISLIVAFLDWCYFGNWSDFKDVLVEAHGLVFDFFFLGVLLAIYENLREKRDRTERYKEELDDYRGWTENEAAYRVAGIIRRLQGLKVADIDFNNLHLGNLPKELVVQIIKDKTRLGSPKGSMENVDLKQANLEGVNLYQNNLKNAKLNSVNLKNAQLEFTSFENATMMGADLSGASLRSANFINSYLRSANLEKANLADAQFQDAVLEETQFEGSTLIDANFKGAKVSSIDWIENLKNLNITGSDDIEARYYVDKKPIEDSIGWGTYYVIKEKQDKREY